MRLESKIEEIIRLDGFLIIQRLMDLGFISRTMSCKNCLMQMCLKPSKDSIDGFNWRCMNYSCTKYQTTSSIRTGSWLQGFKICGKKVLKILLYWSNGNIQKRILEDVDVNRITLTKLRSLLINKIKNHFIQNPIILGGPGIRVHVDETMLNYKVKSHRGRSPREQVWAIGIADTSYTPSKCYFSILPDRTAVTLTNIITSVVREGSIIVTDAFSSYQKISDYKNYVHQTVCHKYSFVDSLTGVHTQNIESNNNKLKLKIKSVRGLIGSKRADFLSEYNFLEYYKDSSFNIICDLLKLN